MSLTVSQLFEEAKPRPLAPGEALFHAGGAVRNMYLVEAGQISLSRATESGGSVVLQLAGPKQVLAEASAYSARYHCDAHAQEPAIVRRLDRASFLERLRSDAGMAEIWAAHLANAVQHARMRAEIRSLRTVAERLDAWLGDAGALPGRGQWQGLADELGVSREALYRELARRRG